MTGGIPASGPVMEGVGSAAAGVGATGAADVRSAGFGWSVAGVAGAFCARQIEVNPKQRAITARFFKWNLMTLLLWQIAENMRPLGIVLPTAPRLRVVIGRTFFIVSYAPFSPI